MCKFCKMKSRTVLQSFLRVSCNIEGLTWFAEKSISSLLNLTRYLESICMRHVQVFDWSSFIHSLFIYFTYYMFIQIYKLLSYVMNIKRDKYKIIVLL